MMNELADRLERLMERVGLALDLNGTLWKEHISSRLWEEREAILKALRLAANMEKLMPHSPKFFCEIAEGSMGPVQVVRCEFDWRDGIRMQNWESDIYTAARKAVEALEKGEGDGPRQL